VTPGDPTYMKDYTQQFEQADYVLFVFDFTSKDSFNSIISLRNDILKKGNKSTHIFLGNKTESRSKELISLDCKSYCEEMQLEYFEISVKNNTNIDKMFQRICEDFSAK
jgi:GTPase SAR1 family protein